MINLNFKILPKTEPVKIHYCILCKAKIDGQDPEFCDNCNKALTSSPASTVLSKKTKIENAINDSQKITAFNQENSDILVSNPVSLALPKIKTPGKKSVKKITKKTTPVSSLSDFF